MMYLIKDDGINTYRVEITGEGGGSGGGNATPNGGNATPKEGEITSKPQQQESWKLRILDRLVKLGNFLHYKYGRNAVIPDEWSRDLYKDIGSIISTERQRVLDEVMELVDWYIENSASPLTMSSRGQDYINGYNRMAALEKQAFKNLKREIQTLKEMGDK